MIIALSAKLKEVIGVKAFEAPTAAPLGTRERKRQQTLARIAEAGVKLFISEGYDTTTLDQIAAAAGISRRTFFYYFKSKEEVLLAQQDTAFLLALRAAVLACPAHQPPYAAIRECLLALAARYETQESILIDRLMRSTEALRARKNARFVDMEQALVQAMSEVWPAPHTQGTLSTVAMIAMGALRLALESWRQHNAKCPVAHYLKQQFERIERQVGQAPGTL